MINETSYKNNPLAKDQESKIDTIFEKFNTADKPGCAVGIIKEGKFIYKKSYGMANLAYDIPLTADSKFEIASTSKQFTAACIALLKLEGKLDLDDDIRKYIPELMDYGHIITIRHLLYHISGIRDFINVNLVLANWRFENCFTTQDGMNIILKQKILEFTPGTKHSYSNSNYTLLAEIIHRITGSNLRKYADKNIFQPLSMNDTQFDDNYNETIKNRVISYSIDDSETYCHNKNYVALGHSNVLTTINDLLKWNNNFETGKVGGETFLELMSSIGYLDNKEMIDYGFGLAHYPLNDIMIIAHGGSFYGFRTQFARLVEQKTSIIVLANRSDINPELLTRSIISILFPIVEEKPTESDHKIPEKVEEIKEIELSQTELENCCGLFWSEEAKLVRKIYSKDGYLYYWRNENSETKLIPVSQNEFIMADIPIEVKLSFKFDNQKKKIAFFENGKLTMEIMSFEPTTYTQNDLKNFVGKYYNEELDLTYEVVLDNDKLNLHVNGEVFLEIKTIMQDLFEFGDFHASTAKFFYNDKSKITGLELDLGDTGITKTFKFLKQIE